MSAQVLASKLNNKKIIMIDSGKIKYDNKIQTLNDIDQKGIQFRENHMNRIRQLGGSANLWANQLMILKKHDVEKRDWVAKDFSWPFNYDELKLYYEEVIKTIYNDNFKSLNYFNPIEEDNRNFFLENEFLNTNMFEFNNHFWPSKVEKFNIDSKFTKKIIHSKNLKFFENFTATEIKTNDETQTIESIKIQSGDKICVIKANYFVLACGTIENARLLFNNEKYSKLLENPNTGKYFMDHPRINFGVLKSDKKIPLSALFGIKYKNYDYRKSLRLSEKYQQQNQILDAYAFVDPKYKKEDEIIFENFLLEFKKIVKLNGIPKINYKNINLKKIFEQVYLKLSPQISSSTINNILRKFFERKNYCFSFNEIDINYQAEQFPNINSKIYLSNKKDIFKQNTAIVDWKLNDIDYKTHNEFVMILKEKYKVHKFLKFEENKDKKITDASHHSGTTRMSLNKSDGVVNKNCKVHEINNLYISGSSVFRSAGSVNPGLTNMAMSIRLGKYLQKLI